MQATNVKLPRTTFVGLALLLVFALGCGPPSQSDPTSASSDPLELTDEMIHERINDAWVREVPSEAGTGETISWRFRPNEPKQITIVDKQLEPTRATIVLDITTQTTARSRPQRQLAGQIRTVWELKAGWALRKWEIVDVENISMKYKNLPMPADQNSNL